LREESYIAPAGEGESELIEKRSRFIGYVAPADSEEAAKDVIARARSNYHDARHHCWCYILREGAERYSDDGEPQGTAGLPMLEVFRREGLVDFCCVVTRYFGGTLLGAGGLSRAYSGAAKLALLNAGIAKYSHWECMNVVCTYNLFGNIRQEIENLGGRIENTEYGENVVLSVIITEEKSELLSRRLADASAGTVKGLAAGRKWIRSDE